MALQGCNYHVCNLPATNQRVSQTAPRSEYGWGGSFPKGGRFQTSDAKGCRAPKNKPSRGGGESKCGVQREMCADLLSSSPDTPTSTRQRQPGPSLRGAGCQPPACVHARTHTDRHTHPERPPAGRRTGTSAQTLLALGRSRWSAKPRASRIQMRLSVHPQRGCPGGPPGSEKQRDVGANTQRQGRLAREAEAGKPGGSTRLHSLRARVPPPRPGPGTAAQGEEEASAVTRPLPFRHHHRALAGPHPHSPRLIKVCRLRRRPGSRPPSPSPAPRGASALAAPAPAPARPACRSPPLTSARGAAHRRRPRLPPQPR